MASYAAGSGISQFSSDGRGFGQGAYDRARAAGYSDDRIRSELSRSGLTAGSQVAGRLGISGGGGGGGSMASQGYGTLAGNLFAGGTQGLVDLTNKFSGNQTLANMTVGKLADTFSTQANMGLNLQYQSQMIGTLSDYQFGLEKLRAGNAMGLIAAEGAINRDIAKIGADATVKVGELQLDGLKYSADKSLQGAMYTSDRSLEGSKYAADKNWQGVKYTADESTNRVRVQGDEDRKTLAANTDQTLRQRADARGAVRSLGSRFYS